MSLSAAISNAVSGLGAVARGTQVVASNLANVATPGYATRELSLSPRSYLSGGGGVQVNGITRIVPQQLLAEYRLSNAAQAKSAQTLAFHTSMETLIGSVNQPDSLHSLVTDFGAALNLAAGNPDSGTYLHSVLDSAQQVAQKLNKISAGIQSERMKADQIIAKDIADLTDSLNEVAKLNRHIAVAQSKGQDTSSLLDNRQAVIDTISNIVPIYEVPRSNGQIAIFTQGGAVLLDGSVPATISFNPSSHITPQMSLSDGHLSSIIFNGEELSEHQLRLFHGGSLEAAFQIRDTASPLFQNHIDAYAQDIYDRFSSSDVDITLPPQGPGIFTDQQDQYDPSNIVGFSSRIQINSTINPIYDGDLWKIRDGLYAVQPGDASDSSLLIRLHNALEQKKPAPPPNQIGTYQTSSSLASNLMSFSASEKLKSQSNHETSSKYETSLRIALSSYGVDSDKEIETLMLLEKIYAANAMVLQTANDMLDNILRIK